MTIIAWQSYVEICGWRYSVIMWCPSRGFVTTNFQMPAPITHWVEVVTR